MAYVTWADLKTPNLGGPRGQTPRPADWDQLIDWQKLWPEDVNAGGKKLTNLAQIHGEGAGNTLGLWTAGVQRVSVAADGTVSVAGTLAAPTLNPGVVETMIGAGAYRFYRTSTAMGWNRNPTSGVRGDGAESAFQLHHDLGANVLSFNATSAAGVYVADALVITELGRLKKANLPVFANNAAALAGGLAVGEWYRTGGDPDAICVVHA